MARHRNVRSMQYDEFDDDFAVGSVNDEPECISPTDAQQWIFDRARGQSSLDSFLSNNEDIQEEDDDEDENESPSKERRDSEHFEFPELNELDKSRLLSCMDEIRNIIGETYSDRRLVAAIMSNDYDFNKALDTLLNGESKPQVHHHPRAKIPDVVEKDFKKISISDNEPKFNNLTELKNYHLEKSSVPFTSKFKLPVLGQSAFNNSKPASSLSEFANSQLKSYLNSNSSDQKPSNFSIPNIFANKLKVSEAVPNKDSEKVVIDLKAALVTDQERKKLPIINEQKKVQVEEFVPQFIDCENTVLNVSKPLNFDDYCERIMLSDLKSRFNSIPSVRFSMIGKIIRKKYHKRIPRLDYQTRHIEKRFKFDTLSPDEQIMKHLKKS
ncbi:hypothetical protein ACKWTF_008399 [Chironomus riparius]